MYVKFKKIRFRNFMSYGNGWTEVNFGSKLTIINAVNGSGKSSIVDAISFVLFGKPYREINIKSLVNLINKRHAEVEIDFDIGSDSYHMMRGLQPSKFEMTKNGETVDLLSSKKLNQVEIDKILGVKYLLFKNVMCIGAISNVPFFNMSVPDRRELLETIFGLSNIAEMLKDVKLRNSNNKSALVSKRASRDAVKTCIENTKTFIADTIQKSKKFEENQAARIAKIREHIDEITDEMMKHKMNASKCQAKLEELKPKFDILEIDRLKKSFDQMNEVLAVNLARYKEIQAKLSNRDKAVCPICGTDLSSEEAVKYFEKLERESASLLEERKRVNAEMEEATAAYNENTNNLNFYTKVEQRKQQELDAMTPLEKSILFNEKQIYDIEKETNDFDVTQHNKSLESYQSQETQLNKEIDELEEKIAVDIDLASILSDDGIKRYFFDEIVPVLNIKVNEYIKKFGLDHEIEFDNGLNYQIRRGQLEMEYNGLSNGEKTRVNVAMMLTFYDIAKQLSNWSCSILFMDEIFDTGIDADGINSFLQELLGMLNRDEKLGVYLISHKLNELNLNNIEYDTMKVYKNGLFSKIHMKESK